MKLNGTQEINLTLFGLTRLNNMNPNNTEFQEMQRKINELYDFMKSFESAAQLSPQAQTTIKRVVGGIKLSDLVDVEGTDTASTGQVLKKTPTTWQPGTDNIA